MVDATSPSSPPSLSQVIATGLANPSHVDRPWLTAQLLAEPQQASAFGITPDNVDAALEQRWYWLRSLHSDLDRFCRTTLGWTACPLDLLWNLWLPLALKIAEWQQPLGRPLIQGISGGQGTGKTTLTLLLCQMLNPMGIPACRLSIDDLYKTYAERQQLQRIDPRFRWRGPPGTHDVALGLTVLRQLRNGADPVALPRFDKSAHQGAGDRTQPEWVTDARVILFEGWFVGARPIDPAAFETAPPPIVTAADRDFAREINQRLYDYLPLWEQLDRLILLYPTDYRFSQQWRQQAEQRMIASGKSGMSNLEIHEFVQYFWRSLHPQLFIAPLLHDANHIDLVIEIKANHTPNKVYCP